MVDDEGSPLVRDPKGHLPGDTVQIEIGFFKHEMHLKEVYAAFEHQDHEPFEIIVRGLPEEAEPPSGGIRFSRVLLRATVPEDAPPGLYRCQRLEAETYTGRRIPFDPSTEKTWGKWQFWVREEPETPPMF